MQTFEELKKYYVDNPDQMTRSISQILLEKHKKG